MRARAKYSSTSKIPTFFSGSQAEIRSNIKTELRKISELWLGFLLVCLWMKECNAVIGYHTNFKKESKQIYSKN
jgi:hypothetical protein